MCVCVCVCVCVCACVCGGGRAKERERESGKCRPVLYPSEMFIEVIGLQRPHSPVLGGILGNVVFC